MKGIASAGAIELVLMSAWLGAAVIVAAAVAPAAFAVLPSRTLAGALVGRILPVVFLSGIVLAICAVAIRLSAGQPAGVRTVLPAITIAAACAVAQFVIAPRIDRIRSTIEGPVEALAVTDPRRQEFGMLHGFSVMFLGIAMLGAIAAIVGQFLGRDRSVS